MTDAFLWLRNVLKAIDQAGNALLGGAPDQTISSRAYEAGVIQKIWYWRFICNLINAGATVLRLVCSLIIDTSSWPIDHCQDAYRNFIDQTKTYQGD